MSRRRIHQIEQVVVLAIGFFLGAALAVCIAPGDIALWAAAGLVLSIFCRAFLIGDLGGDFLWPFAPARKARPKPNDKLGPTAAQH
jgi:hypothetical protein